MVQKIPPPPMLTGQLQPLNRWLLEIQSILSSAGIVTFANGTTAVTQPPGDNSSLIATDAFVLANSASAPSTTIPLVDATPGEIGTASTFARGDHVHPTDTSRAPLNSPNFTGTPEAPTAAPLTDDTQIATTAYADLAVAVETARAEAAEALLAPLNSPNFTGTPEAPTAGLGTNTTQLATTAFVLANAGGSGGGIFNVKAAVFFTAPGGVVTVVKSGNVTSVTRTSAGNYEITFTSAFADANYFVSAIVDAKQALNGFAEVNSAASGANAKTATTCTIAFLTVSGGALAAIDPDAAYALFLE